MLLGDVMSWVSRVRWEEWGRAEWEKRAHAVQGRCGHEVTDADEPM